MKITLIAFSILFASCDLSFTDKHIKVNNEYYVWITHGNENLEMCYLAYGKYNIGMFGPRVYSTGADSEYLIAKVHPLRNGQINDNQTIYYIIPLRTKVSEIGEKNFMGPYSEKEFFKKRKDLQINTKLDFNQNF